MALWGDGISALLIDGKLSDGRAGTFPTVNPATEEVLGVAADADAEDMGRAIEAPRGGRSTRPTGPAIPNFGCGVFGNCATQCNSTSKNYAN